MRTSTSTSARLVDLLLDETERRGYRLDPDHTGGYANRPIRNTRKPRNHSWGLAVDLNWDLNPATTDGRVHTNFPHFLVPLWGRYGFAWGGNYRHAFKDPMHLEFMGAPADADDKTLAATRQLPHAGPGTPPPHPHAGPHTYTVQPGDTLFLIASRLRIAGGWKKLYDLNRAVIGNDQASSSRGRC